MGDPKARIESIADRLGSWKEIAAYFGRDVRTVQRWEDREGLPVHRHQHARRGSVYAFRSELDAWWESRRATLSEEPPVAEPSAEPAAAPASPRSHAWRYLPALAVVALVAAVAVAAWTLRRDARAPIRSIAVLPLTALSGQPEETYFADGLTEAVLTDLAQVRSLRVISRSSVLPYREKRPPLREIARTLGVEAVAEGAVLRSEGRVRVTARLVEVASDRHLWAHTYERPVSDAVELQSELARAIADGLRLALEPEVEARLAARTRPDPEAYQAYLKGRFLAARGGREALFEAADLFRAGMKKDPGWAPMHAGLAEALSRLGATGYDALASAEAAREARREASRALELDPDLAEAHAVLGFTRLNFEWDWREAEADLRRALELNPGYAVGHRWLSRALLAQGRFDEALVEAQKAVELDPLSAISHHGVALVHAYARAYDLAIAQTNETLRIEPDLEPALLLLGVCHLGRGDHDRAIDALETAATDLSERPWALALLGHAYGRAGRHVDARKILDRLEAESRKRPLPSVQLAVVRVGLGEKDAAFALLDRAVAERNDVLLWLKVHPVFDPLRSDPRFERLLRDVGLPSG